MIAAPNQVRGNFSLPLLTTPRMRVRSGRFDEVVRIANESMATRLKLLVKVVQHNVDGFVKSPTSAFRCIFRHCDVP